MLGDVVSSRSISDRENFQKKLGEACKKINKTYVSDIYGDFRILKGVDEVSGVLSTISNSYDIITAMLEQLYPHLMRFVLVCDYIDTALETRDVARMDGPAFHRASDIMNTLKKSKLMFDMSVDDELMDAAITGQINLILLLKRNWSQKQHQIVREYEKTRNQYDVAKKLGITQQAVSKALTRSMWKEIKSIEENLDHILHNYPQREVAFAVRGH